jgi:hypothetical protein
LFSSKGRRGDELAAACDGNG